MVADTVYGMTTDEGATMTTDTNLDPDDTTTECDTCGAFGNEDHDPDCDNRTGTSDLDLEKALIDTIERDGLFDEKRDADLPITSVVSMENGGYLTRDRGLVVTLADGSEFQITIVRAR